MTTRISASSPSAFAVKYFAAFFIMKVTRFFASPFSVSSPSSIA